jgi:hypothetical protein
MHFDAAQLQRFLDQELDPPAVQAVHAHLTHCGMCRAALRETERQEEWLAALLRRLDHEPPAVTAQSLAARAGARRWSARRWAAAILLLILGAGAAYAAPGSPLPRLLDRLFHPTVDNRSKSEPSPVDVVAGIAVDPGSRFTISFEVPPGPVAEVGWTDEPLVTVRERRGRAVFDAEAERLTIRTTDSAARFEIEIPRSNAWIEIRHGAQRLLLKEGDRVRTAAPLEPDGRYRLRISGP